MPGLLEPRPLPQSNRPVIAGGLVVALALPVFVLAGWPLDAWALAAALWVAGQLVAVVLRQLPLGAGNLGASGAVALGRTFRTVAIMVVLIVVTAANASLGLPAVAVYALAYTVEFATSLATYFGGEAGT